MAIKRQALCNFYYVINSGIKLEVKIKAQFKLRTQFKLESRLKSNAAN